MTMTRHGRCGKSWWQSANRTGHCAGCHLNFDTLPAFDRHRRDGECLDPSALLDKDDKLVFESRQGRHEADAEVTYWRLNAGPMPKFWLGGSDLGLEIIE